MKESRYFKYFAYICHCPADARFARRLGRFLTRYKLPARIQAAHEGLPRELKPICIDKSEAQEDYLNADRENVLSASKFLIVICSKEACGQSAALSKEINDEVTIFANEAEENRERIIPVMIRDPKITQSKECMPEAVRELNILAADVSDKGEERVFSDVVAKMLGLAPNELWDWWGKEQAKRKGVRRRIWCATGICTLAAAWWCWDYSTPHSTYFEDYILRDYAPEGVCPMDRGQCGKNGLSYKFTSQFHRIQKVECLTEEGKPATPPPTPWPTARPAAFRISYSDKDGSVLSHTYLNEENETFMEIRFEKGSMSFWEAKENGDNKKIIRVTGMDHGANANVQSCETEFGTGEQAGLVMRILFRNAYNLPVANKEGYYGIAFQRDRQGCITDMVYLDRNGQCSRHAGEESRMGATGAEGANVQDIHSHPEP